jgi:MFS family permease
MCHIEVNSLHRFLPNLAPLRLREFRLIYIGQFVSAFGSAMTYVVLPFQMYALTRSALAVGLIGVVEFVPMLTMALIGGALADHFDRRRLIGFVEFAMVLCCAVLAWNAALPTPHVAALWIVAGLLGGLGALHRPAMEALVQQVLPVNEMIAVGALNSVRGNFAFIVGPGLAGVIAAKAGATAAFAVDGLSYLVSIATIIMMRPVARMTLGDEGITLRALLEGWRYARGRQDLLGTYLIDINATFFGMPNALFPAMAEQWGAASVGLLYAAPSLGAMIAALTSGWASGVRRHGLAIAWAAALWGVAIAAFGCARSLWLALIFLAAAGAADMVSGIFRMAVWNQTIPSSIRGRTAAIEMVSYHTGPSLGNAEAGFAARLFGVRASVVSGGLMCVAGSLVLAMILPKFIAYDSTEGARRRQLDEALFARAKDAAAE